MLKSQCKTLAKPKENLFSDSLAEKNRTAQRFQRTNIRFTQEKVRFLHLSAHRNPKLFLHFPHFPQPSFGNRPVVA